MKKILRFFLSLLLLLVGFFSFRTSIPFFEIKQTITFKKNLINHGVKFDIGGFFVSEVNPNSPASQNGIEINSQITLINGEPVNNTAEFVGITRKNLGKPILLTVCKSSICRNIRVTPREKSPEGQGPLGIVIHNVSLYNKTTVQIIYDEIYKRFTGKDFFSAIFEERVVKQSWFMLVLGILSTTISVKLMIKVFKKKHS